VFGGETHKTLKYGKVQSFFLRVNAWGIIAKSCAIASVAANINTFIPARLKLTFEGFYL